MTEHCTAIALEEVFVRSPDGVHWSPAGFSEEFWQRYTSVFDNVSVIARVRHGLPPSNAVLVPAGIEFYEIPAYSGLLRSLMYAPFLFFRAISMPRKSLSILRAPGVISLVFGLVFYLKNHDYAVELVGDIDDVLKAILPRWIFFLISKPVLFLTQLVVRNALGVAYVTSSTLQEKYPSGQHKVTASYSSVLINEVSPERPPIKTGESLGIISVGTLTQRYKGFDTLIKAIGVLTEKGVDVRSVIVGEGPLVQEYKELAGSLGVLDRVVFSGRLSREEVLKYMDVADLYVSASRTEGLPRVIIEAMSRALPVVSTPVGGCKELVLADSIFGVDDVGGLVLKIEELKFSPDLWFKSMKHSRSMASGFVREKVESRRQEFLRSL